MRIRDFYLLLMAVLLLSVIQVKPVNAGCDPYGVSTLRGDAINPLDWDEFGLAGALHIRRPFVRFASDGTRLFIKGFEFEVKNAAATGEYIDSRALKVGLVSLVYRYMNPDTGKSCFGVIPYTFIFEKGDALPFIVSPSTGTAEAINTGYVRLVADIPPGVDDTEAFYIPAGARELALMLIYRGTIGEQTKPSLSLGGYWFDQVAQSSSRLAFYRVYGGAGFSAPGFSSCEWNPSNILTILPTGEDVRDITGTDTTPPGVGDAITRYFGPSWSPKGGRLAMEKEVCSKFFDYWDSAPDSPVCLGCDEEDYRRDIIIVDLSSGRPDPESPEIHLEYPASQNPGVPSDFIEFAHLYLASFSLDGSKLSCMIKNQPGITGGLGWFDLPSTDDSVAVGHIVGGYIPREGDDDYDTYWEGSGGYRNIKGATPVWSPQEDTIAYYLHAYTESAGEEELKRDVYTIAPDGSQDTAVTNDSYFNTQQEWTPDGQWFVFTSNRLTGGDQNGSMDVWIMDRNGQNRILIYDGDKDCWSPTISPDGLNIAFRKGNAVCTIDLKGQNYKEVYTLPDGSEDLISELTWSPYLDEYLPTVSLTFEQDGGTTTLAWASTNADRVLITHNGGSGHQMNGTIHVSPATGTTYTLMDADIIAEGGGASQLTWTLSGAGSVNLNNSMEDRQPMTGEIVAYPAAETTYTVTAYNWAGKTSSRVTVAVDAP